MADDPLFTVFLRALLAGGFAGCAVDLALFPLDSLKTRIQAYKKGQKLCYRNPYAGLKSAVLASFPCAATFWGTYTSAKSVIRKWDSSLHPAEIHLMAAACASTTTSLVRTPFEVIKQQLQVGLHRTNREAIVGILSKSGPMGLFVGLKSLVMREIPFDAIQFLIYERLKYSDYGGGEQSLAMCLRNGAIAGCVAAFVTTPIDVVKTRMMTQGSREYRGILQSIGLIFRSEGLAGLWSGWKVRVLYITTGGMIFFGTFEGISKALARKV